MRVLINTASFYWGYKNFPPVTSVVAYDFRDLLLGAPALGSVFDIACLTERSIACLTERSNSKLRLHTEGRGVTIS